jgi:Fur family transcriptional regulator, peroxide stress response regulator
MTIKNTEIAMTRLRNKCREHGLRVTHQKVMIYKKLLKSLDHPSPEQIFTRLKRAFPEMSFDTIYRTLSTFDGIGLVNLVEGYGTARRFDPKLEKHHHFRCRKCGTIIDFTSDYYDKIDIPKDISKDCEILKLRVTIEGYCKKCRSKLR